VSVTLSGTDLTALIANWADDGASSSGLFFRDDAASSSQQIFYDSAETVGKSAPRLIVDYDAIPEPSSSLPGLGALSLLFLRRRR
jgi:hypothetical protein